MNDEPEFDVDALPLTQGLVLEVLAARHRTGERTWTFPRAARPALKALEAEGLVWWKEGVMQGTVLAGLLPRGQRAVLDPAYEPPNGRRSGIDPDLAVRVVAVLRAAGVPVPAGWTAA